MAQTSAVTLRMDNDIKEMGQLFFKSCGLSFNQGMVLLLEQAIAKGEIVLRPKYSTELLAAMKESDEILEHPENYKLYDNIRDLYKDVMMERENA